MDEINAYDRIVYSDFYLFWDQMNQNFRLMETKSRLCGQCARPMRGRTDKRFCSSHCRNSFNNKRNGTRNRMICRINQLLQRNRRILEQFLPQPERMVRIHLGQLSEHGFDFRYHTQAIRTGKGNLYCFVYEYGYRLLENGAVLLLRKPGRRPEK